MIILSGLLVVGAIALLVLGITSGEQGALGLDGLQLIYISIAVSVVSALCLAIGVLIRRKELFGGGAPARTAAKAKAPGRAARQAAKKAPAGDNEAEQEEEAATAVLPTGSFPMPVADVPEDALVYVVQGRKRYHLESCRQLAGRDTEELTYVEAREEGFSPCTACLPDTALAARATVSAGSPAEVDDEAAAETVSDAALTEEARVYQPLSYEAPSYEAHSPYAPSELDKPFSYSYEPAEPVESAEVRPSWREESPGSDPEPPETRTDLTLQELTGASEPPTAELAAVPAEQEAAAVPEVVEEPEAEPELPPSGDPAFSAPTIEAVLAEAVEAESRPEPVEDEVQADPVSVPEQSRELDNTPQEPLAGPLVRILSGTKRYHRPDCALIEDIGDEIDDLESLGRDEAKARGCTPCLVCQPDKEHAV
ncbi:MAG: hypothetical protein ABIS86_05400 [Streptosporangiaceae bacterium]